MPIFPSGPLTVYRRAAMASDFEVSLNATRDDSGADAALDALDEVDRIEDVLSIFRPTTLASRVNLLAAELNVRVDEEFWDWLETAIRFSEETEGAFDVAAAPIWRAWGSQNGTARFRLRRLSNARSNSRELGICNLTKRNARSRSTKRASS